LGSHVVAEEIVSKPRRVGVLTAPWPTAGGGGPGDRGERSPQLRDELLDGEVFCSLAEAKIVIEGRRRHHNTSRPHSALGYRPPAPEVVLWPASPATRAVASVASALVVEIGGACEVAIGLAG
jgi:hypothetical protein